MLLLGVGYLGLFGLQLMGGFLPVQGYLLQCVGEKEADVQKRKRSVGVPSAKERCPVSNDRGQEKKGKRPRKSATWLRLCTSAIPQSSWQGGRPTYPCGERLESPNLSAALPNMVAYGGSRLHIAPVVRTVYMPCSSLVFMMMSVFQTSPLLYILEFNISYSTPLTFLPTET